MYLFIYIDIFIYRFIHLSFYCELTVNKVGMYDLLVNSVSQILYALVCFSLFIRCVSAYKFIMNCSVR